MLVQGYALMSNHFHLVVTGREEGAVSRLLQHVTGQYAQYLHGRLNRRGRLWQSRFYSCVLDAHHFLSALAYVDLNPVRARMLDCAVDSAWSSAAAHCGLAATMPEWLELEALHGRVTPAAWRERLRQPPSRREVAALRRATRTECPLGKPGFVEEREAKFQVRLRPLPPGPRAKKPAQARVRFECRHWARFPDFHGFLYGSVALVGKWEQDGNGQWDVHTPLVELMKDHDPQKFKGLISTFKNAALKP